MAHEYVALYFAVVLYRNFGVSITYDFVMISSSGIPTLEDSYLSKSRASLSRDTSANQLINI